MNEINGNIKFETGDETTGKVIVKTKYTYLTSTEYLVFAKANGKNHVEINNLNIEDLEEYIEVLKRVIEENRENSYE